VNEPISFHAAVSLLFFAAAFFLIGWHIRGKSNE
jgi:hypothetical protein